MNMRLTVVVDEVGDSDAEQGAVKTGVETDDTLAVEDALGGGECAGVCLLLLDLGAGGEGDERVALRFIVSYAMGMSSEVLLPTTHVKAMDKRPPPAPARAWATLSLWTSAAVAVTCGVSCLVIA
jgi:hypothetical protein